MTYKQDDLQKHDYYPLLCLFSIHHHCNSTTSTEQWIEMWLLRINLVYTHSVNALRAHLSPTLQKKLIDVHNDWRFHRYMLSLPWTDHYRPNLAWTDHFEPSLPWTEYYKLSLPWTDHYITKAVLNWPFQA